MGTEKQKSTILEPQNRYLDRGEKSLDLFSSSNLDLLSACLDQSFDTKCYDSAKKDQQTRKGVRPIRKVITLRKSSTVTEVKNLIFRETHIPPYKQDLFFRGKKLNKYREEHNTASYNEDMKNIGTLQNERTINEYGIVNDGETLLLIIKNRKINSVFSPEDTVILEKDRTMQIDSNNHRFKKENLALLNVNNAELQKDISLIAS